jgi:hypothetical protein
LSPLDKTHCTSASASATAGAGSATASATANIDYINIKRPVQLGIAYADVKAFKEIFFPCCPPKFVHVIYKIVGFGHFWSNLEFVFGK